MMTDRGGGRRGGAGSGPGGAGGPAGAPRVPPDPRGGTRARGGATGAAVVRRLMALVAVCVVGGFLLDRACGGPPPVRGSYGDQPSTTASTSSTPNPDAGNVPAEEQARAALKAARAARAFQLTGRADLIETGPVDVALTMSQSDALGQLTVDGTRVRVR